MVEGTLIKVAKHVASGPRRFFSSIMSHVQDEYSKQTRVVGSFVSKFVGTYQAEASEALGTVLQRAKQTFSALLKMVGVESMSNNIMDVMQMLPGGGKNMKDQVATAGYNITLGKVVDGVREELPPAALTNDQIRGVAKEALDKKLGTGIRQMFGVTTGQLVAVLIVSALTLASVFAFIFVGISVFTGATDFMAIINALVVAGAGLGVNQKGKKDGAPQSNEVLRLIPKTIMKYAQRALQHGDNPEYIQGMVDSVMLAIQKHAELGPLVQIATRSQLKKTSAVVPAK